MNYTCVKAGSVHHYYLNGERIEAKSIPESLKKQLRCKAPTYRFVENVNRDRGDFSCIEVVRKVDNKEKRHRQYYENDEPLAEAELPVEFKNIECAEEIEEETPKLVKSKTPIPPPIPRKPTRLRNRVSLTRLTSSPKRISPPTPPPRNLRTPTPPKRVVKKKVAPKRGPVKKSSVKKSPVKKRQIKKKVAPKKKQAAKKKVVRRKKAEE